MTTAIAARSGPGFLVAGAEHNTGSSAGGLRQALTKLRAYRATLTDLRELTDRQLSDIGMSRTTLKETALQAVYGVGRK